MRQNEYLADEFAYKIGFGLELATVLDRHIPDVPHDGFLRALYATHPYNDDRVAALQNLGVPYEQPPASDYQLVYDGELCCPTEQEEETVLARIFHRCNDNFPDGYAGRSLSPSDVVELYDGGTRKYFYCNSGSFVPVKFSPMLAKRIPSLQSSENG